MHSGFVSFSCDTISISWEEAFKQLIRTFEIGRMLQLQPRTKKFNYRPTEQLRIYAAACRVAVTDGYTAPHTERHSAVTRRRRIYPIRTYNIGLHDITNAM